MTRTLAIALLRFYPREWRIRYEEEVRLLLEDSPPGLMDVFSLAWGATSEWAASFANPAAHPWAAATIAGAFSWWGAVFAIQLAGMFGGAMLEKVAGVGPAWASFFAWAVVMTLCVRGLLTGIYWRLGDGPFRPLSRFELRLWWTALVVAVVLGHWSDNSGTGMWQFSISGPAILLGLSERNWMRAKARAEWLTIRNEHRDRVRRYMFVSNLVSKGLATREELDDICRDVARLNSEVERAATAYRATAVFPGPPRRPIGL